MMRETRSRRISRLQAAVTLALFAQCIMVGGRAPSFATQKFGALELSGNVDSQNLVRHPTPDKLQFIQNRNTLRIRVDYDWLQNGKLIDRFEIPFIERSKLFLLYRGVYDGFYDIAPTDLQVGQTRFDDIVGGPIKGNDLGQCVGGPCSGTTAPPLLRGNYSRLNDDLRSKYKFENVLREVYVDLKLKDMPLSFRLGRQQVIWGESDQFRLMDIWNPLDVTWHLQQESGGGAGGAGGSWDNIRIPLWLAKGLWDIGEVGPISNSFLEVVYNPFDFQPNQKLDFLPRPWTAFIPNPLRAGQLQRVNAGTYLTPVFNLQGTSFRKGAFHRNPQDASEVGLRFHGVTPQGLEFSTNYLYARGRGVGAGSPLGVKIKQIGTSPNLPRPDSTLQVGDLSGTPCTTCRVAPIDVVAEIKYPYNHIFGLTGNYFEGDYTAAVLRFETAYTIGEPVQTVDPAKTSLPRATNFVTTSPLGFDKRDIWAGMVGFDRSTWIRWLNSKTTWFLSAQFFWSYYTGNVNYLRGNSGAGETPYFTPSVGLGSNSQGLVRWTKGPYAGLVERLQAGACEPGVPCLQNGTTTDPSGDAIHRWEHLVTIAATTFYKGGTVVPFAAVAIDPVNANLEALWNLDYFITNNLIVTPFQKFFTAYGRGTPSDDPWGAGGRNTRRDETGVKVTYQF